MPSLVRSYKFIWYLFTVVYKSRPFKCAAIVLHLKLTLTYARVERPILLTANKGREQSKGKQVYITFKTDITRNMGEHSLIYRTLPFIIDHWLTPPCGKSQNALCKLTRTLNPTLACKKSKVCVQVRSRV